MADYIITGIMVAAIFALSIYALLTGDKDSDRS